MNQSYYLKNKLHQQSSGVTPLAAGLGSDNFRLNSQNITNPTTATVVPNNRGMMMNPVSESIEYHKNQDKNRLLHHYDTAKLNEINSNSRGTLRFAGQAQISQSSNTTGVIYS